MDKEDVVCIYNGILLSHKKNKTSTIYLSNIYPLAATGMQLEIMMLSEVSQKEKDKYHMMSLIHGILKNETNEFIYGTETDSDFKHKLTVTREKGGG